MKTSFILLSTSLLALACSAQTISIDSFDVPVGTAAEFNLQTNAANRQTGSAVALSYSDASANIIGSTQVYLTQTEAFDGIGVLNLRALIDGQGQSQIAATAVLINEDLVTQLAGQKYAISYSGVMIDRFGNATSADIESSYQSFTLSGTDSPDPTSASTDLGFVMHAGGTAQIWGDGQLLSAVAVPGFASTVGYTVQLEVDESTGAASASVEVAGVETNLPEFTINFSAGESRIMKLMNRVFAYSTLPQNPSWDFWLDAQINDLQITKINATSGDGGAFSISNGYYRVSGTDGLVTEISLDQTGNGNYDTNTIKPGAYSAFTIDGVRLESATAAYSQVGDSLTISGLPNDSSVVINLDGNTMTWSVSYSGARQLQHEWIFDFRASGFYNRLTGTNSLPTAGEVDMPFESFHSEVGQHKSFWPVEAFKSFSTYGPQGSLGPVLCRARADRDDSVFMDARTIGMTQGIAESDRLTLITGPASKSAGAMIFFELRPKTYVATVDGSPLPEFYVSPDVSISPLSDSSIQLSVSDLMTEFYQHTLFWWGSNGGIWSDWIMKSCGMMDKDSWYVQHLRNSLSSWLIATDGSSTENNYGYAFTWGGRRGWPFDIYDDLDNRHFNNNAIYITALWRYVMWTGDTDFLQLGSADLDVRIDYTDNSFDIPSQGTFPFQSIFDDTNNYDEYIPLGQTFTATKPFNKVAIHTPTWASSTSGLTLTLYQGDGPGGTQIAQDSFSNVANNGWPQLTFAEQAAGIYYVEMTDPVGTIGWWGHENALGEDLYPGGEKYLGGGPKGDMMTRARALMHYQQTKLGGAQHHLITLGPDVSDHHQGRGFYETGRQIIDVQGNWYDMLPFGYQDLFANINYYESLRAMADLEELAGDLSKANEYRAQLALTRVAFSDALYRSGLDIGSGISASRFIATKDVNGVDHDYGYAGLNAWAIASGLASNDQTNAIFDWMDNGKSLNPSGTWSADIYDRFKFAPRGSTIYNNVDHGSDSWWRWETAPWDIIQNGGTSLHETGFDIEARAKHLNADSAWNRLSIVLARYADPDRMSMANGYYGETAQGARPDGSWVYGDVGWMYAEFPETALAGASFFNGFFGIELSTRGLRLEPSIPTGMDITKIGARNIHYHGARFNLEASIDSITLSCTHNPDNQTFYMTGGYSGTGIFTRTIPLDQGAMILSPRPQQGIEELSLGFSKSNDSLSMQATFMGTTLDQYLIESTEDLTADDWTIISQPFSSNTDMPIDTSKPQQFFRAVKDI